MTDNNNNHGLTTKRQGNFTGRLWLGAECVVVALMVASFAQAAIVVPPSLSPGDTYHLAFVSSTTRDATSTDIADYNDHVQAAADAAGIGSIAGGNTSDVEWFAIASTGTVDARVNALVGTTSPIFLLNGAAKVADGFSDLWDGTIDTFLDRNELLEPDFTDVWTGSSSTGFADRVASSSVMTR